jgi:hypothetical protein
VICTDTDSNPEREIKLVDVTDMSEQELHTMLKRKFGNDIDVVFMGDLYLSKGLGWSNANTTSLSDEECIQEGYLLYDTECFTIPAKDVLMIITYTENTEDERTYFEYYAVLRDKDLRSYGVKIKESGNKKIFTKKYKDGMIRIETNKDDEVIKTRIKTKDIKMDIGLQAYDMIVKVKQHYDDGCESNFKYRFTRINKDHELPWYLDDIYYYRLYLKKKSVMPLIEIIMWNIKGYIWNDNKNDEERDKEQENYN